MIICLQYPPWSVLCNPVFLQTLFQPYGAFLCHLSRCLFHRSPLRALSLHSLQFEQSRAVFVGLHFRHSPFRRINTDHVFPSKGVCLALAAAVEWNSIGQTKRRSAEAWKLVQPARVSP